MLRPLRPLALAALLLAQSASAQNAPPVAAKQADAVAAAAAAAEDASKRLDAVLADLAKSLGAVKTLRCRFEQRKYLPVFEEVVVSEGTLALAVPDKLRWEYVKPLRSVLTVNGRQTMRERTSRRGVTTRTTASLDDDPVTQVTVQQVFLWVRGDFAKARESHELALVSEKPLVVRATPKEARLKQVIASVELTFSDDRKRLSGVTLAEKGAARTEIRYLDAEIDRDLPASLFEIRSAASGTGK